MDNVNEYLKRPSLAIALGVILGLILGLVIGWGIWPVKYFDAAAVHLRADLQDEWVKMAVSDYKANQDAALLKARMGELQDQQGAAIDRVKQARQGDAAFLADLDAAQNALGAAALPADSTQAPATDPAAGGGKTNLTVLLGLMCLLTLVVGAVVAYLLLFRGKKGGGGTAAPRRDHQAPMSEPMVEGETPVVQYLSTYTLGSDLYDDSFSIDSATGEFLGECGVGISETIGVGDPKKVTAFEVWLFDKNDIQTVTKVLMSAHAFGDPIISQRLASKGEPVQAEPGKRISLETATLKLEARVVTMSYGSGALPANSFFDQVTLELQVFPKAV